MQGSLNKTTTVSWPRFRRIKKGFSLVEMIVTIAVAFIIIVALMQSMVSSLDSWTKQDKQFSSLREGRAALRLLADDLASIAVIPGGGPMADDPLAVAGKKPLRILIEAGGIDSVSTSRLAFLRTAKRATKGAESGRGDLQLVLYGVALTPDRGASGIEGDASSQKLVRRQFSAQETFKRLESHRMGGQPLVFEEDWMALERAPDPEVDLAQPGIHNAVLAHDVIRFDCRGRADLNPAQSSDPPTEWPNSELPTWVEIKLRVTNRQTGRLLKSAEDWRGEGVRASAITNGTPDIYEDDQEVRTLFMRMRLPSLTL